MALTGSSEINACSGEIVDAAIRVHSVLGPGLLESAYTACLAYELTTRGLEVLLQVHVPLIYRGVAIDVGYRLDMLVNDLVVVELKTVTKLLPIHEAQLLTYLRLSGHQVGLLMNFHVVRLKDGLRRLIS